MRTNSRAPDIVHLCDVMTPTGYLANMERGPGRHGIADAFSLYVRDPRRQTLWGTRAPRSWFEEGTPFAGTPVLPPLHNFQAIVAD
jgi:hypothetical protein